MKSVYPNGDVINTDFNGLKDGETFATLNAFIDYDATADSGEVALYVNGYYHGSAKTMSHP
jgi:hypothetical protein